MSTILMKELSIKMTEWFSDAYWHWRNVFYFRFSEYNDNIDRGAFFEELNYGWLQMYSGMWDDPIPEGVDPWNLRGRS